MLELLLRGLALLGEAVLELVFDYLFYTAGWLAPRLHRFQAKHPEIEVRMTTTQRRVDFAREDFDCAIRFTVQPEPDVHATRLFSDVLTPLCGRRYRDKLKTLEDLKRVPFIDMT